VLAVTYRLVDDDGVELSHDDRREDYLERIAQATGKARWVCAADTLHNASSILADLRRTLDPDTVWSRFSGGKGGTIRWYRSVYDRLGEVGFTGAIMGELGTVVASIEEWAGGA
jgi:alkanesulfonate monooxygenase SsuD/methylene tetrahydromethanopterin reductase-like flavin-dependent oxidoreductase (luciferase family)